jgi:hypothetical protein
MANWYGSARSNYFRVKDKDKFVQWVESIAGLELIEDGEGRVGLLSNDESGGWPCFGYDEEAEDHLDIEVFDEVAAHLEEGSVAVFLEAGAEKLRYITGHAVAVNSKGDTVAVALCDIYRLAESLGNEVTAAEY